MIGKKLHHDKEAGSHLVKDIEMTDYTKFYGFSENPFDLSADSKFFFSAESHSEALAALSYGITQRKGFVLILGELGIGKTTLINRAA